MPALSLLNWTLNLAGVAASCVQSRNRGLPSVRPEPALAQRQFIGSHGAAIAVPTGLQVRRHFPGPLSRLMVLVQAASYNGLSMKCPGCRTEMTAMMLDGHLGARVNIDVCVSCQAFWFDRFESLQLSAGSTLRLMKFIGEHSLPGKPPLPDELRCPRCETRLRLAHDMQRNMPFTYWRCGNEDGRFIGFFEFLKEKNFIHPLSPEQLKELRQNVQFVNCSNCGASINLESSSVCSYCHSPVSMLDMKQPQQMLEQLRQAAEPRPIDPALPLKLALAKLETGASLAAFDRSPEWWSDARSSGLVQAGLNAVTRWLSELAE